MEKVHRSRFDVILFGALLAPLLVGGPLSAQQPAETLPGFKPNNLLEAHDLDNVNLFSGDPGVVIPLGPEYPLGPGNTWQLKAYYSAKLWYFDSSGLCILPDGYVHRASVTGYPTIGAGWTLNLGYIDRRTDSISSFPTSPFPAYYSSDGGEHRFAGGRTFDRSRLRITAYPPTGNPAYYTVEFPDGTTHVLAHKFLHPKPISGSSPDLAGSSGLCQSLDGSDHGCYGLSYITDPFGATLLSVEYASNALDDNAWKVTAINLTPASPQGSRIVFNWGSPKVVGTVAWAALDSISFPTSNGSLTAIFSYVAPGFGGNYPFYRNGFDDSYLPIFSGCPLPPNPRTVSVPLLKTLTFSSPSIQSRTYTFSNHLTPTVDTPRDGLLEHITLPTGGLIDYTYDVGAQVDGFGNIDPETGRTGFVSNPSAPCPQDVDSLKVVTIEYDSSAAVVARIETDPVTGLSSTSTYDRTQVTSVYFDPYLGYPSDGCSVTRATVVHRPSGNGATRLATRHVFNVPGLTFGTPLDGGGYELARRIYADDDATGTPVRTIVNCYGSTSPLCGFRNSAGQLQDHGAGYPPPQGTITWFGESPVGGGTCVAGPTPCISSVQSIYNSLVEKFSQTDVTSTLPAMPGWVSRSSFTEWRPASTGWNLDLFRVERITEGSSSYARFSLFENNGFAQASTIWDAARSKVFGTNRYRDDAGNLTSEWSATADYPFEPAEAIRYATTPTGVIGLNNDAFGKVHTAQSGLTTSSRWFQNTEATPLSWYTFQVTRDPATGLIMAARDTAGLVTTYSYDALGRLTHIAPPGEAPTDIQYDLNQTIVTRTGSDGLSTRERYLYDGFGRLMREIRLLPGSYAVRFRRYDDAGHVAFLSEWASCPDPGTCAATTPTQGTTNANFDPFDRPQSITRADGQITAISYTDDGSLASGALNISHSDTLTKVTANVSGSPATSVMRKDLFGRVIAVAEPAVAGTADVTRYTYDLLDRLTGVAQGAQTRSFVYDNFGFQRSESTPEKGAVSYDFGSLGNIITSTEPGNLVLTRTYDASGRLTLLTSNEGGSRPYLSNTYNDTAPGPSLGKMTQRVATNYAISPASTVTDGYVYDSVNGRLWQRTTSVTGGTSPGSVTQKWAYNSFGLVAAHWHPRASGASPFEVTTAYQAGLPTAQQANGIPIVTGIAYQPDGSVGSYTTGFGIGHDVTTTILQDVSLLPRAGQIFATEQASGVRLFDTQTYRYDGAGNITSVGGDLFSYDGRSRLTSASLAGLGSQAFAYDRYGNLLSKAGVSLPTDGGTNHLTTASYDSRGNLIASGGQSYAWDGLDRMTLSTGTASWFYLYDGANERVAKAPPLNGDWTYTFRDDSNAIAAEFTGANTSRNNVFLGRRVVASYANCAVSGGCVIGGIARGPWQFYSSDHLGTPRLITGPDGSSQDLRKYWPFGDEALGAPDSPQHLKFAFMERDPEGSRYYNHARSEDFGLGRFLTPDSRAGRAGDPQSWNRYPYASNNPLKLIDPDGLEPQKPKDDRIVITVPDPKEKLKDYGEKKLIGWLKKLGERFTKSLIEDPTKEVLPTSHEESSGTTGSKAGDYALEKGKDKLLGPVGTALEWFNYAVERGEDLAEALAQKFKGRMDSFNNRRGAEAEKQNTGDDDLPKNDTPKPEAKKKSHENCGVDLFAPGCGPNEQRGD